MSFLSYFAYSVKYGVCPADRDETMYVDTISDFHVVGLNFICSLPDSSIALYKTKRNKYEGEPPNIVALDTVNRDKPRLGFEVFVIRPHCSSFVDKGTEKREELAGVYSLTKGKSTSYDSTYWVYDYTDHTQNDLTIIGRCRCADDTTLLKDIIKSIRIYRDSTYREDRHKSIKVLFR